MHSSSEGFTYTIVASAQARVRLVFKYFFFLDIRAVQRAYVNT